MILHSQGSQSGGCLVFVFHDPTTIPVGNNVPFDMDHDHHVFFGLALQTHNVSVYVNM